MQDGRTVLYAALTVIGIVAEAVLGAACTAPQPLARASAKPVEGSQATCTPGLLRVNKGDVESRMLPTSELFRGDLIVAGCQADLQRLSVEHKETLVKIAVAACEREQVNALKGELEWKGRVRSEMNEVIGRKVITDWILSYRAVGY